jgi:hypothetical protein
MSPTRFTVLVTIAVASAPIVLVLLVIGAVGHIAVSVIKEVWDFLRERLLSHQGEGRAKRFQFDLNTLLIVAGLCAAASFVVAELGWNKRARWVQRQAGLNWRGLDVSADPKAAGEDLAFHQKIAAAIQAARITPAQRVKHFAYLPGCDTPRGLIGWHGSIQHVERVRDGWLARVRIMPHLAGPGVCFTADYVLEFYHYRPDGTVRLVSVTDPGPGRRGIVFCD